MPFALAFTLILLVMAGLQIALIFGAPLGRFTMGGQHRVLPGRQRIGAAASILIYALMTLVAWDRVGVIEVFPDLFSQIAMWVIFGFFVFSIVLNAISRSKAERYTMVPVSIVLSLLCFFIAMGYGTAAMAI